MNHIERHLIRRVTRALLPVVCPPELAGYAIDGAIVEQVEASLASFPRAVRAALVAGMASYELGALAFVGREAAERYFRFWWHGPPPLGDFAKVMKGLICQAYYESPQVKAELGYTPEAWIDRVKRRRLAIFSEEIRRHEEQLIAPDPLLAHSPAKEGGVA